MTMTMLQEGRYDDSFLSYIELAEAGVEEAQYNAAWLCQEFEVRRLLFLFK